MNSTSYIFNAIQTATVKTWLGASAAVTATNLLKSYTKFMAFPIVGLTCIGTSG